MLAEINECAFNIKFWGNFSEKFARQYEKIGLNATDIPPGANRIQAQYGILALSIIMSATTIALIFCEFLGIFVPKITNMMFRWSYQYLVFCICFISN